MSDEQAERAVSPELELSPFEQLALASLRLAMMDADIAAESSADKVEAKSRDRDAEIMNAILLLRSLPDAAPSWVSEFVASVDVGNRNGVYQALRATGLTFGTHVRPRPRAMMVLIDAVMFDPWSGKLSWHSATREKQLAVVEKYLPDLEPYDLGTIKREYVAAVAGVRRNSTKVGDTTTRALSKLPTPVGEALTSMAVWLKSLNANVVEQAGSSIGVRPELSRPSVGPTSARSQVRRSLPRCGWRSPAAQSTFLGNLPIPRPYLLSEFRSGRRAGIGRCSTIW